MPHSKGSFGIPEIASDGIQVMDVTDDSMRMGPPRSAAARRYSGARANATGKARRVPAALRVLVVAAALAPERQRAGDPRECDREQRLVRAAAFDGRRRALGLALDHALADLPSAPAEDGVPAVDDSHPGVLTATDRICRARLRAAAAARPGRRAAAASCPS